ncbi:LysR family transcriptional regulator substrate-binding protein, partial [Pseudomonas sp. BGM005]|nr:LysR family transcriptional regulator substrate-binding protein [Pseudomonas sp. BG5]
STGPPPSGFSLTRMPLLTEELVVVSAASQPPVAITPAIGLEHLATLPLIALDETYELRATTDAAFRSAGITPNHVLEGAEMDAVLRFVERGVGV